MISKIKEEAEVYKHCDSCKFSSSCQYQGLLQCSKWPEMDKAPDSFYVKMKDDCDYWEHY
jgi:hypothetical protein